MHGLCASVPLPSSHFHIDRTLPKYSRFRSGLLESLPESWPLRLVGAGSHNRPWAFDAALQTPKNDVKGRAWSRLCQNHRRRGTRGLLSTWRRFDAARGIAKGLALGGRSAFSSRATTASMSHQRTICSAASNPAMTVTLPAADALFSPPPIWKTACRPNRIVRLCGLKPVHFWPELRMAGPCRIDHRAL